MCDNPANNNESSLILAKIARLTEFTDTKKHWSARGIAGVQEHGEENTESVLWEVNEQLLV